MSQRIVGSLLVVLALGVASSIFFNCRKTYLFQKLHTSGITVRADLVSWDRSNFKGRPVSIIYRFRYQGHTFSDQVSDFHYLANVLKQQTLDVRILPDRPDIHETILQPANSDWADTLVGCTFIALFSAVVGFIGFRLLLGHANSEAFPPPSEIGTPRLSPAYAFFAQPVPRPIRYRRTTHLWTAFFTCLLLIPPAYASARWNMYLQSRRAGDSFWPWDVWTMIECLLKGFPYFLVALPAHFIRLYRAHDCKRLASTGVLTFAVVDWTLKKPSKSSSLKINGSTLANPAQIGNSYWVPYTYLVNDTLFTVEGPDGYSEFKAGSAAVAARLPTGASVPIVYSPGNPQSSRLLPYLRKYLQFPPE